MRNEETRVLNVAVIIPNELVFRAVVNCSTCCRTYIAITEPFLGSMLYIELPTHIRLVGQKCVLTAAILVERQINRVYRICFFRA